MSPSRSSSASRVPVEAPDGTAARPTAPDSSVTSTSTVGLPRESRISRPWMLRMFTGITPGPGTVVRQDRLGLGSSRPENPAMITREISCPQTSYPSANGLPGPVFSDCGGARSRRRGTLLRYGDDRPQSLDVARPGLPVSRRMSFVRVSSRGCMRTSLPMLAVVLLVAAAPVICWPVSPRACVRSRSSRPPAARPSRAW